MKAKAILLAILIVSVLYVPASAEWTEPVPVTEVNTEFAGASLEVNSRGQYYFQLDNSDIYSFISAYDLGVSVTADVKNLFTLDNGQKDFYYDRGKLFLASNSKSATGTTTDVANSLAPWE